MAKNLCIDWGNTRVKTAIFENNLLIHSNNFSKEEAANEIQNILGTFQPEAAILCKVSEVPLDLEESLAEKTKLRVLDEKTSLPIMNAYNSSHTLGMDRIALSVGMQITHPGKNNLVICIGSAITYNFCQKNGIFRGGNITPGMKMRFQALHDYADQLPMIDEKGEVLLLGYDTETCIRSGVVLGIASEIDGMINNYRAQFPDFNVILTGGDYSFFEDKLKNRIFADPQLLLKGLNSILNHNA